MIDVDQCSVGENAGYSEWKERGLMVSWSVRARRGDINWGGGYSVAMEKHPYKTLRAGDPAVVCDYL